MSHPLRAWNKLPNPIYYFTEPCKAHGQQLIVGGSHPYYIMVDLPSNYGFPHVAGYDYDLDTYSNTCIFCGKKVI